MADEQHENPTNPDTGLGGAAEDSEITTNWDEITTSFEDMGLKDQLLRGIFAYGFENPSAIQQVRFIIF